MRQGSEPERLLQRLYELPGKSNLLGLRNRNEEIASVLQMLAEQGDLRVVPAVARFLFFDSTDVRIAACRTVHRLLSCASPEELIALSVVEWSWGQWISDAWEKLKPSQLQTLVADESTRTSVLGLASFHRNGYVRHQAVRLLATSGDGGELPYLLIRQNDWVRVISADAQAAVQARLTRDNLPALVQCLPLVVHLLAYHRHDLSPVVRRVVKLLLQPQEDARFADVVRSSDRTVRRHVVQIALDLGGEQQCRVIEHGLASEDAVLRLRCARRVRACFAGEELSRVLERLRTDHSMPVRREALQTEAEAFPESAQDLWRQALLDPHASIRELARFKTVRVGGIEPARFYRTALSCEPSCLAALSGLGETGDESDLPIMRSYLKARLPSRRRAAVRGLAAIGREAAVAELIECLRDDSPAVVREVRQQLRSQLHVARGESLLAITLEDHRWHVREAALHLIFDIGKWRSLPWLIRASAHGDKQTAELAQALAEAWFLPPRCNRVFTRPSSSEREAILNALARSRPATQDAFRERLEGWLHHN